MFEGLKAYLFSVQMDSYVVTISSKMLYKTDLKQWIMFGLAVLRAISKMGLDRQLFLMSKKVIEDLGICGFYQSV